MPVSLDELMANNTPQPWTRGAARSIFDLFAGHEPAKQAGYTQGLRLASLLEGARRKRDENLGFAGITPQAVHDAGFGQNAANLLSTAMHAGVPISQIEAALKDRQAINFGNQAWAEATGANPDLNLLNRENMVRNGKPVALSTVEGNTLLNAMVTPDAQTVTATPQGQANIDLSHDRGKQALAAALENTAQANQANEHARVYDAQADAGGWNPHSGSHNGAWPSITGLKAAFTTYRQNDDGTGTPVVDMHAVTRAEAAHAHNRAMSFADYMSTLPRVGVSSETALGHPELEPGATQQNPVLVTQGMPMPTKPTWLQLPDGSVRLWTPH